MEKSAVLALALPLMAGACMVGPDFERPETTKTTTYAAAVDAPLPADQRLVQGGALNGNWWSEFRAPGLDSVVDQAIADNQDIAAARARVAEAQESVKAATGALLPQLSVGANATNTKYGPALIGPSGFVIPTFTAYSAGPNASFPTDLFGGGRRLVEQKAALAEYHHYELEAAHLTLEGNVVAQAFAMAASRAQVTAVQAVIDNDSQNVRLVETAIGIGSATQTQLVAAQSQLANDRTLLPALHQQLAVSRHALAILVSKAPAEWSSPDFALEDFTLPAEIPDVLPSELAHHRPDILAAEAQLHAACAEIGVATANLYPQLTLTVGVTAQSLALGGPFSAAWSVAAGLLQPIFDGGQLSAQRRAAIDRYNSALATYRQTVVTALGQVADQLQALANDADQLRSQEEAVRTAVSALDLARRSFTLGNTGIVDVIDAQRLFAEAELGRSRARAQRLMDTAQLYLALGGTSLAGAGASPPHGPIRSPR
jgi:NodT family efflux transporter outer membrane factor (OMF) lipoprotein